MVSIEKWKPTGERLHAYWLCTFDGSGMPVPVNLFCTTDCEGLSHPREIAVEGPLCVEADVIRLQMQTINATANNGNQRHTHLWVGAIGFDLV